MNTLNSIESEIAALPPNLRAEVLDFVQFVKQRHGIPVAQPVGKAAETGDPTFFQALEKTGFIGCIETDEQFSTTYKNKLDFSAKGGTLP